MLDDSEDTGVKGGLFWTDIDQTRQRILGSVVLYKDIPVYVRDVVFVEGPIPRLILQECNESAKRVRKRADSPHFNKYRTPLNMGWMNSSRFGAVHLSRRAARSQHHGLTSATCNIQIFRRSRERGSYIDSLHNTGGEWFGDLILDEGLVEMHQGVYPDLAGILDTIKENSAIAFSNNHCIVCDEHGVRWMFRGTDRVGIVGGNDTLLLLRKYTYLREEFMDEPKFTLNQIREL